MDIQNMMQHIFFSANMWWNNMKFCLQCFQTFPHIKLFHYPQPYDNITDSFQVHSEPWITLMERGTNIYRCLQNIYRHLAVDKSSVVKKRKGQLSNFPHSNRLPTTVAHAQRHLPIIIGISKLNVAIGCVNAIIHRLEYRKVYARWVPWRITNAENNKNGLHVLNCLVTTRLIVMISC